VFLEGIEGILDGGVNLLAQTVELAPRLTELDRHLRDLVRAEDDDSDHQDDKDFESTNAEHGIAPHGETGTEYRAR